MPKETPKHGLRYPEPEDPDTLATYWQHLAEDTEEALDEIAPSQIVGGMAGKLIVAGSTGAGAYKAMKGDATLAEDGTLTIGAGAVGPSKLAAGAALANLAAASVTSPRVKLTAGRVSASGDLDLTGSYADVPGASLTITPMVESKLLVTASFDFKVDSFSTGAPAYVPKIECIGSIKLDAAAESSTLAILEREESAAGDVPLMIRVTCVQTYELTLTAAEHTIKLRAKSGFEAGTSYETCFKDGTGFTYILLAA